MNTQDMLKAINEADPCYKIAKVSELQAQRLLQPGDLDGVSVVGVDSFLGSDTYVIYYQDGEYVDLHEAHNDYDALVAILYDNLN